MNNAIQVQNLAKYYSAPSVRSGRGFLAVGHVNFARQGLSDPCSVRRKLAPKTAKTTIQKGIWRSPWSDNYRRIYALVY